MTAKGRLLAEASSTLEASPVTETVEPLGYEFVMPLDSTIDPKPAMVPVSLLPPPSIRTVSPTPKPTSDSTSNSVTPAAWSPDNVVDTVLVGTGVEADEVVADRVVLKVWLEEVSVLVLPTPPPQTQQAWSATIPKFSDSEQVLVTSNSRM